MSEPTVIKKYGNRRLYDTGDSRYITLDELAAKIQDGVDVRVVDARSGADLTQATLTQIIIEGRGAARMLPVALLTQLIRLGDDALAEFFGRYMTGALDLYLQARRGVSAMAAYNPFATMPLAATDALARMWAGAPFGAPGAPPARGWSQAPPAWPQPQADPVMAPADEPAPRASEDDVASLRRELEELKRVFIESRGPRQEPGGPGGPGEETRRARAPRKPPATRSAGRRSRKRSKPGSEE